MVTVNRLEPIEFSMRLDIAFHLNGTDSSSCVHISPSLTYFRKIRESRGGLHRELEYSHNKIYVQHHIILEENGVFLIYGEE
jgi:hypothetical protein